MDNLDRTLNNIKSLKIQGAENISKCAVISLKEHMQNLRAITKNSFLKELEIKKKKIIDARPTEPCLRNCLNYISSNLEGNNLLALKKKFAQNTDEALNHITESEKKIADIGSKLIPNRSVIFTHCHSSTVIAILKKAKESGKLFEVHNTETRPMLQGRKTAKELSELGIPVVHYIDSAARLALKKCDMALFGCDAITTTKIYNKIGTEMFAEIAKKHETPVFFCADSWKMDPKSILGYPEAIEQRNQSEVWQNPPKGVKISNYAFEKIDFELATGIVSELGVYKPEMFIEEVKLKYKNIFS